MPYDQEGRFIYPQPASKSAAKSGKPKVTRSTNARPPLEPLSSDAVIPVETPPPSEPTSVLKKSVSSLVSQNKNVPQTTSVEVVAPVLMTKNKISKNSWPENFGEIGLAYLWNAQNWPDEMRLTTSRGESVQVVYRGRWSGNFGPDFKGAILNIGGELRRGDVELHLKTSGWRQHGHQDDGRYDNVVLHVVLVDDEPQVSEPQRPILVLADLFEDAGQLTATIEAAQSNGTRLGSVSESVGPCCDRVAERHPDLTALLQQIDDMGEARFLDKVWQYEAACSDARGGAAQAIWAGLLEALGYSQNKAPFRRLAAALPFETIVEIELAARARHESEAERLLTLEAALLGAAGLLPSQRRVLKKAPSQGQLLLTETTEPQTIVQKLEKAELQEDWAAGRYTDELERRWQFLERTIRAVAAFEADFRPLVEYDWTFARLRPPNHPSRRVAGLARLLARLKMRDSDSLHEALARLVLQAATPQEACARLDAYFVVALASPQERPPNAPPLPLDSESDEFWARRFDFANRAILVSDTKAKAGLDLVGADRAADIVVNVALPFLVGLARYRNDYELEDATLAAYRSHPRLGSNELVDNVAKQVFRYWLENPESGEIMLDGKPVKKLTASKLLNTARRQQGLIHLHRRFVLNRTTPVVPYSND